MIYSCDVVIRTSSVYSVVYSHMHIGTRDTNLIIFYENKKSV